MNVGLCTFCLLFRMINIDTACQNQNLVFRCWIVSDVSVLLSLASFFWNHCLWHSLIFLRMVSRGIFLISRTFTCNSYLMRSPVFFIKWWVSFCCTCFSSSMFGAMAAVKPYKFTVYIFSPLKCEKVHFSCVFSSDGCAMDTFNRYVCSSHKIKRLLHYGAFLVFCISSRFWMGLFVDFCSDFKWWPSSKNIYK